MVTYRKVPAKIICIDYIGVPTAKSQQYRKLAEAELAKLEGQVSRGDLRQGTRQMYISDNVVVEATVMYELREAVVIIGGDIKQRIEELPCYCCSPCLVAGMVVDITAEWDDENQKYLFEEDADYYGTVRICQAASTNMPTQVTLYEERAAAGNKIYDERVIQGRAFGVDVFNDVVFSDYERHQPGSSVLVLVQPLYGFTAYPGVYSPCINRRRVANEAIDNPWPTISTAYVNSSGFSCQIAQDYQLWDETLNGTDDEPVPPADVKYFPFRVLPITIDSCLTS